MPQTRLKPKVKTRRSKLPWTGVTSIKINPWTKQGRSILHNTDKLTLSGGLLYCRHKPKYQIEEVKCFIVPSAHRRTTIDGFHCDAGHQGKKRTESLISDQFWWPGVYEDVNRAVQNCRWCQLYGGREEKAPMVPMMVTAPPPASSSWLYFIWDEYKSKWATQSRTHLGNCGPFHEIYQGLHG